MPYLLAALLLFAINSNCYARQTIELDYDTQRAGGDYANFAVRDVDKCSRQCERDSRCLAFDFDTYNRQCYLKDRVHQPRNNPYVISGVKNLYGGGGSYRPGDSDHNYWPRDEDRGYRHGDRGDNYWPRDGDGGYRPGGSGSFPPGNIAGISIENNIKLNGGDYTNFTVGDVEECAEACSRDNRCRSFNYGKQKRDCWLKNSVPKGVPHDGVISGVKGGYASAGSWPQSRVPAKVRNIRLEDNVKRNGGDYTHFTVGSVEECARACSIDNRCWSLNYGKQKRDCWLKNTIPNGIFNNSVISGSKGR